ncbi:MAG: nitrous oxide reductase accessory protein NosL [Rhodothermia bacterium]|nr:nitrous oxide reductase accessory protein NosL [Rhodothermia bacterium]
MTTQSRIVLAAASLALILVYIFPIWKISLDAPQYPEGLGLYIWIDAITGENEHDLQNINGLNHYIGMKTIVPDSIPELKIMPWFIGFMIVFGLAGAASGKRFMMWSWIAIFMVGAVVGLVDFYLWEYDYGHNLDAETAIIKIPGMNYQPPLIGSKKLLNFTASSWPALGGWITFISLGSVLVAAVRNRRKTGPAATSDSPNPKMAAALVAGLIGTSVALSGCTPGPSPIRYGEDQCDFCRMTILDERYGAELVGAKGKVYRFDSIECLASHVGTPEFDQQHVHSLWVADFASPGSLVEIKDATILHSDNIASPMGMNLAAFGPIMDNEKAINAFGGKTMGWEEVVRLVSSHGGMHPASMTR